MADRLYEANWRELSVDLQKYFVVMLGNAQRPVFYDGFGIAILNLETFSKVTHDEINRLGFHKLLCYVFSY